MNDPERVVGRAALALMLCDLPLLWLLHDCGAPVMLGLVVTAFLLVLITVLSIVGRGENAKCLLGLAVIQGLIATTFFALGYGFGGGSAFEGSSWDGTYWLFAQGAGGMREVSATRFIMTAAAEIMIKNLMIPSIFLVFAQAVANDFASRRGSEK